MRRHVVLKIDEGARPVHRNAPQRGWQIVAGFANRRLVGCRGRKSAIAGGGVTGSTTFGEARGQGKRAVAGPGGAHCLHRLAGHKNTRLGLKFERAARLREQMHARVPAARHRHAIASQLPHRAACSVAREPLDRDGAHPPPPGRGDDDAALKDRQAGFARQPGPFTFDLDAGIDDGLDLHAGFGQIERRRIGAVIVGEHYALCTRSHAVAVDIALRRPGQHDAGPVVVGEDQGPFQRAGRQHDLSGAYLP